MDIIIVLGTPAAGKSNFGSWLEREHGYLHLAVEKDGRLKSLGLQDTWNACFTSRGIESFLNSLGRLGRPVLLNWGFPPEHLDVVKSFKAAGLSIWWFDADYAVARVAFLTRGDVPAKCFDIQMDKIKRIYIEIKATFAPNIILTLLANGSRLAPEVIHERMFGQTKVPA